MVVPQYLVYLTEYTRDSANQELARLYDSVREMERLAEQKAGPEADAVLSSEGDNAHVLIAALGPLAKEANEQVKRVCTALDNLPDAGDEE